MTTTGAGRFIRGRITDGHWTAAAKACARRALRLDRTQPWRRPAGVPPPRRQRRERTQAMPGAREDDSRRSGLTAHHREAAHGSHPGRILRPPDRSLLVAVRPGTHSASAVRDGATHPEARRFGERFPRDIEVRHAHPHGLRSGSVHSLVGAQIRTGAAHTSDELPRGGASSADNRHDRARELRQPA